MKQLYEILEFDNSASQCCSTVSIFTLKFGSTEKSIEISSDLRMRIQDLDENNLFRLKENSLISPSYKNNKVNSITIWGGSLSMALMEKKETKGTKEKENEKNERKQTKEVKENEKNKENGYDIEQIYMKLKRHFSHKGFTEFYRPVKRLGRGTFATVYLVEHRFTGKKMAAKVFSKEGQKIEYKGKEALANEIKTLKEIDHPNLIKFDGLYETDSLIYLVTEYLSGGTLEETLKSRMSMSGEIIQNAIRDILSGLAYLDENQIMHRDIKPENVILRQEENVWVIGDFGLAAKSDQEYLFDKCGTMGYIAPEIMDLQENEKYRQMCDMYSLGVIAYQLVIGELPFKIESINFFDKKVVWLLFEREECRDVHPKVLEFLKRLLDPNPETRIKPKEALMHPFFTDEEVVHELFSFHDRKKQARFERILKMANVN